MPMLRQRKTEAKKNFQNGDFELGLVCSSQNSSAIFEGDKRNHDFWIPAGIRRAGFPGPAQK